MNENYKTVAEIVNENKKKIFDTWINNILEEPETRTPQLITRPLLIRQSEDLLDKFTKTLQHDNYEDFEIFKNDELLDILHDVSVTRAELGFTPSETASYIFLMKDVLFGFFQEYYGDNLDILSREVLKTNKLIDRMGLITFETFSRAREEIILKQNRAILELSTPVIKLWNGIVMLPLVGIIDTARSQEMIERLLQGIVDNEAQVAVIDISGVPIIDTRVAQHLIKTVTAATMLGAEVILTGISPEIAQTIIKLDIDLSMIRTRGSLKAGIEDAFNFCDMQIVDKK